MQGSAPSRMVYHLLFTLLLLIASIAVLPDDADAVTVDSYFLLVPGIEGESNVVGHVKEIVVLGFSLDFTKGHCGDFRVVKNIDAASPRLMLNAVLGTTFPSVVLTGRTGGSDRPQDFLKLTLTNAVIGAVNITDSTGDPPAIEAVTFTAKSIEVRYTAQSADGSFNEVFRELIVCR